MVQHGSQYVNKTTILTSANSRFSFLIREPKTHTTAHSLRAHSTTIVYSYKQYWERKKISTLNIIFPCRQKHEWFYQYPGITRLNFHSLDWLFYRRRQKRLHFVSGPFLKNKHKVRSFKSVFFLSFFLNFILDSHFLILPVNFLAEIMCTHHPLKLLWIS